MWLATAMQLMEHDTPSEEVRNFAKKEFNSSSPKWYSCKAMQTN